MKRLIIHIGYPKTATTSLQENVFTELDGQYFNYLGKRAFASDLNPYKIPNITAQVLYGEEPSLSPDQNEWLKRLDKDVVVFSNENLSMAVTEYIDNNPFLKYSNPFETAKNLKNYFSEYFDDIQILIVLRSQKSLLYSYYVEIYKWRYRLVKELNTFHKFFKSGLKNRMSGNFMMFYYDKLVDTYAELFGKTNVHLLFFEDLKEERQSFFQQLSTVLKVNTSVIEENFNKRKYNVKKNKSGNYVSDNVNFLEMLNKNIGKVTVFEKVLKLLLRSPKGLKEFIKKVYNKLLVPLFQRIVVARGKEIPKPTEEQLEITFREFRDSNINLANSYQLDKNKLKRYEYL
jgi:hypothetical protein